MLKKLDKKSLIYLAVVVFAALLSLFLIRYFSKMPEIKEGFQPPQKPSQEDLIQRQLEELERLRAGSQPLTQEQIKAQLKELGALRKKQKPLSEEEIQKQLEELNRLRPQ